MAPCRENPADDVYPNVERVAWLKNLIAGRCTHTSKKYDRVCGVSLSVPRDVLAMNAASQSVKRSVELDLNRLKSRAFDRAKSAEPVLRRYHAIASDLEPGDAVRLQILYDWFFAPLVLWPFNIQDVLESYLSALEKGKRLNARQRLLADLLHAAPGETIWAAVAEHEVHVQKGAYEDLVKSQAKYAQVELAIRSDAQLLDQWARIKTAFDVDAFRDHKGVIRRTMGSERNLRPSFSVDTSRREDMFHVSFDAFCLRWNLYGMQNDEPLLLKLAVNITPYGTMIHIPAYWSFDPKRDIRWGAIAKLHRLRVPGRQGTALAEGKADRRRLARLLVRLDQEAKRLGLKGEPKHAFLCQGLGWVPETSARRVTRLRREFPAKPSRKPG
jgi:hypothetical protein